MARPSPGLAAMLTAAAALPAYSGQALAQTETGYRFSHYAEEDLSAADGGGVGSERYRVTSHQFSAVHAINDRWGVAADILIETMSGASPWFVTPDSQGRPVQIMSGASIEDSRNDLLVTAARDFDNWALAMNLGVSVEDDYQSLSGGVQGEWTFNNSQNVLSAAVSYAYDTLTPTDGGSDEFPTRIVRDNKSTLNIFGGVVHDFTPKLTGQLSMNFQYDSGFLSDPYKLAFVDGDLLQDSRPDTRSRYGIIAKLRYFVEWASAALHLDTRIYSDSWDVSSDTVELRWLQSLPGDWTITPSLRWYQQSFADFYRPFFNAPRADGLYSSDYRLSAFGAFSGRISVEKQLDAWGFGIAVESYNSDGDFVLEDTATADSPGNVDFTVISAALNYNW